MQPTYSTTQGSSSGPRRTSVGRRIGYGILILIGVLLVWHFAWRIGNNRAVARLEQAARQRGEPITVSELASSYPKAPDAENIHAALLKVWAAEDPEFWNAFSQGTRPLPERKDEQFDPELPVLGGNRRLSYTNELSAEDVSAIRQFLKEKKTHMDGVRVALALKTYSANYNFGENYAMLLPQLSSLKREAQFFQLEALNAMASKDAAGTIVAIGDITRVGNCLKDDPLLIGQLVRIACYQIALGTMERLMKQVQLSEAECARLDQILEEMCQDDGIKRALVGERTFAWAVLDGSSKVLASLATVEPGSDGASSASVVFGYRLMKVVGMSGAEKRLMGETYDQAIRCLSKPDYAATDEMRDIFTTMEKKGRRFPPKILTMMLMPALEKAGEKAARLEAMRRCAKVALIVERHRLAHTGVLPGTFGELSSSAPDDPFSREPLQFKKTERGYVIYSVGPDHKDNDGLLEAPKGGSSPRESDIGFRVEHK